ncbi:MAG TPA: sulfatase [Myxococcota bacterium]|nr:sulfatase [Myxococcota bacterium]
MSALATPLRYGLLLGATSGALEVGLRASPRQGLGSSELLRWWLCSVLLGALFGLLLGLGFGKFRRAEGLIFGGLLAMQAGINYRFEWVLNNFLRDPRVWGGLLLIGALSVGISYILHPLLRRIPLFFMGILGLFGLGLTLGRGGQPAARPAAHFPVLVVSLDTVRFDHLSPYGYPAALPNLQRIADEGARFTQAIAAAPITEPSHLAMFTGIAPYRSGVVSNGTELGDRPALVWRDFAAAGWRTAGFVAGFPLHGKYGWDQGMQVWDDDFGAVAGLQSLSLVKVWNQVAVKEHALRERPYDRVLARALPFLQRHRDEDFFAFVHFYDAHGPYVSPYNGPLPTSDAPPLPLPAYWPPEHRRISDEKWLIQAYDNEIRSLDDAIGQLLTALGPRLDDTLLVITADHGESLTEHGYYFDHGDNLYDPSLRVPLLIRWPGKIAAGLRIDCQVGGVDLAPTLLEFAGLPDQHPRDGISRVPELRGEACRDRPALASTVSGRSWDPPPVDHALRSPGSKLIRSEEPLSQPERGIAPLGEVKVSYHYFDLLADPGERSERAEDPRAADATMILDRSLEQGRAGIRLDMDAETKAALQALGYLNE